MDLRLASARACPLRGARAKSHRSKVPPGDTLGEEDATGRRVEFPTKRGTGLFMGRP